MTRFASDSKPSTRGIPAEPPAPEISDGRGDRPRPARPLCESLTIAGFAVFWSAAAWIFWDAAQATVLLQPELLRPGRAIRLLSYMLAHKDGPHLVGNAGLFLFAVSLWWRRSHRRCAWFAVFLLGGFAAGAAFALCEVLFSGTPHLAGASAGVLALWAGPAQGRIALASFRELGPLPAGEPPDSAGGWRETRQRLRWLASQPLAWAILLTLLDFLRVREPYTLLAHACGIGAGALVAALLGQPEREDRPSAEPAAQSRPKVNSQARPR